MGYQNPKIEGQTTQWQERERRQRAICKTLHRKLKLSKTNPTKNRG